MKQEDRELFITLLDQLLEDELETPVLIPKAIDNLNSDFALELGEDAATKEEFVQALSQLILETPRTTTGSFFNQLFGGRNSKATLGELLSVLLNSSMYTYKIGGPMIAIEKEIVKRIINLAGYPEGSYGTFATGGSMTNYMALIMARDKFDSNVRNHGVTQKMIMYTSAESHYSVKKNASFAGLGRDNIRFISTNDKGEMDTAELKNQIQSDKAEGLLPFFINATAGTTVLGSVDPLEQISEISHQEGVWMHIDAAFYGSTLFSEKYKQLVKGIENSDSFSMNAHKMLSTPLTCSLIFTKHKTCLYDSFGTDADYLYQGESDDWNPGKISFQCGRRNDALKFWTLWKSIGRQGIARMVEKEFELAEHARNYVNSNSNYKVYNHRDSLTLCFNYKDVAAEEICSKLTEDGLLMVGYGRFKNEVFVRLPFVNSSNDKSEIDNFFKLFEECADSMG